MNKPFGLGDLAYYFFRPVVYGIDLVWGTDMRHCSLCKARRARWNYALSVPRYIAIIFLVTLVSVALRLVA